MDSASSAEAAAAGRLVAAGRSRKRAAEGPVAAGEDVRPEAAGGSEATDAEPVAGEEQPGEGNPLPHRLCRGALAAILEEHILDGELRTPAAARHVLRCQRLPPTKMQAVGAMEAVNRALGGGPWGCARIGRKRAWSSACIASGSAAPARARPPRPRCRSAPSYRTPRTPTTMTRASLAAAPGPSRPRRSSPRLRPGPPAAGALLQPPPPARKVKATGKSKATASNLLGKRGRVTHTLFFEDRRRHPSLAHLKYRAKVAAIAEEWRRRPGWQCTKCAGRGCMRCDWTPTAEARLAGAASAKPAEG